MSFENKIAGMTNNEDGPITVQNPLATDGDRVYAKDVNVATSDIGDFSGTVTDLFDDIASTVVDSSATNPKTLTIKLHSPMNGSSIKLCTNTGNFSNVTITLKDASGTTKATIDESASATKYTSRSYDTTPVGFCTIEIEFATVDTVTLSFIYIKKANDVHSQLKAIKPDGTATFIDATAGGNLKISLEEIESGISSNSNAQLNTTPFCANGNEYCDISEYQELVLKHGSRPLLSAVSTVNKFGAAPDFDTGDGEVTVWDGAEDGTAWELMNYVYSTTADIDSISSSNAGDTQDIEIQGLDTNGDLTIQTITLTGQTRAALTTSLKRVFRAKNVGSTDLAGHVFVYVNGTTTGGVPDTNADIRAVIQPENNQTEMAVYTIPTGKTGYIRYIYGSSAGASRSTKYIFRLYARPSGQVFQLKFKEAIGDDSSLERPYDVLLGGFSAGTDIEMTCELTAAAITGANVISGFDIILVDN